MKNNSSAQSVCVSSSVLVYVSDVNVSEVDRDLMT